MAYFYSSNHPENFDNYQYYQCYYNHDSNHEPRYVQNYDTEYYGNSYHYAPNSSLVGYYYSTYNNNNNQPDILTSKNAKFHENGEYYYHPVSTEYIVSYNSAPTGEEDIDVVLEQESPKPFHGGYDIHEKYGKPLPPSEEICHPPSKYDPNFLPLDDFSYGNVPPAYGKKEIRDLVNEEPKQSNGITAPSKVIQEETPSGFEEDEEEYDDEGEEEEEEDEEQQQQQEEPSKNNPTASLDDALTAKEDKKVEGEAKPKKVSFVDEVIQEEEKNSDFEEEEEEIQGDLNNEGRKEEEYGTQIRRQIPPGYGIEAIDLCEGVFGGYFPCLWKRNQRVYNHQRDVNEKMSEYDYCWKETADYLFGNPNPYGGSMPEKGSYGDPVYNYQRYHPQQTITEQVQYYGGNSSYW